MREKGAGNRERGRGKALVVGLALLALLAVAGRAGAYPSAEVILAGGVDPPFDFGISGTVTGFGLLTDQRLAVSYSQSISLIDVGSYALEPDQPPAISVDAGIDGRIMAILHDSTRNRIIAAVADGDLALFDLSNITATPSTFTLVKGDVLGPIALDEATNIAYVADNTALAIQVVDVSTRAVTVTIPVTGITSFSFTDALYDTTTDEAYFATDAGVIVYIPAGATTASLITIDLLHKKGIPAIAQFSNGRYLYALDAATPAVYRIQTSDHTVMTGGNLPVTITDNPSPTDLIVTDVVNPTATYAYVAGAGPTTGAITVIDTADDTILDLDPGVADRWSLSTTALPYLLAPSSSSDGNIYMDFSTAKLGILSVNPFNTISSVTYSDGSSSLKKDGSFTMVFQSNQTGTYVIRAGGTVTGNGTLLKDSSGQTSGSLVNNTPVTVTINQADNASAFTEGRNSVWVFVTSSGLTGRRATNVNVDLPPPNVVLRSVGFGDASLYVNFDRLTVSDMASYNVYADTDPAAVLTKTEVAATAAQASSGSTQSAKVSGLTNGTTYYIAIEGVDQGGTKSLARTNTLADGTVASGMPEATVGPAGLSGETGCSLGEGGGRRGALLAAALFFLAAVGLAFRRLGVRRSLAVLLVVSALFVAGAAWAEETQGIEVSDVPAVDGSRKESPQMWSFEVGAGFWLPKSSILDAFFTKCCNVIPKLQGGVLFQKRYGIDLGVGVLYKTASEVGVITGRQAQDRFSFLLIPMETNFTWRADYFSWRYLVPYLKTGVDYVYYREGDVGGTVKGVKFGIHGEGGLQINIGEAGDMRETMDADFGINDLFLTLSARYQWINNFGGKGLDLSGQLYSIGLLFEF